MGLGRVGEMDTGPERDLLSKDVIKRADIGELGMPTAALSEYGKSGGTSSSSRVGFSAVSATAVAAQSKHDDGAVMSIEHPWLWRFITNCNHERRCL